MNVAISETSLDTSSKLHVGLYVESKFGYEQCKIHKLPTRKLHHEFLLCTYMQLKVIKMPTLSLLFGVHFYDNSYVIENKCHVLFILERRGKLGTMAQCHHAMYVNNAVICHTTCVIDNGSTSRSYGSVVRVGRTGRSYNLLRTT